MQAVRFGDLGAEVQAMRTQLNAAQQRLSSQAATHTANITTLERRIANPADRAAGMCAALY